jgi:hypothetical protein
MVAHVGLLLPEITAAGTYTVSTPKTCTFAQCAILLHACMLIKVYMSVNTNLSTPTPYSMSNSAV